VPDKPFNTPHKMLLLPATLTNKLYNSKHKESDACTNIVLLETTWAFAMVLPQSKHRFNLQFDHGETLSTKPKAMVSPRSISTAFVFTLVVVFVHHGHSAVVPQ